MMYFKKYSFDLIGQHFKIFVCAFIRKVNLSFFFLLFAFLG